MPEGRSRESSASESSAPQEAGGAPRERGGGEADAGGRIEAEWGRLTRVAIHRPGMEMFFGLLEPFGSLYERSFSQEGALREHRHFENVLVHECGVDVMRLQDAIVGAADRDPRVRERLIQAARDAIEYVGLPAEVEAVAKEFEESVPYLDTRHFLWTFMMRPVIAVDKRVRGHVSVSIEEREPLANLFFMRDQQFVTDSGVVMGRMAKPVRRHEPDVTGFLLREVLGMPILHETREPGTIEGGEFIPMGSFALVGRGDRTNRDAVDQLLRTEMGYSEVAVVHQAAHPLIPGDAPDPMVNMHLDTYFNVASRNVAVGHVGLWKAARVEIFHNEGAGRFTRDSRTTDLHEYIASKGFEVCEVTTLEQLSYASNFLCIDDGRIVAIEVERVARRVLENLRRVAAAEPRRYSKLLGQAERDYEGLRSSGTFFPHKPDLYRFGVEAYPVALRNLTGGYGGAHCMTCALSRDPPR